MTYSRWLIGLGLLAGVLAADCAQAGCCGARRRCALFSGCRQADSCSTCAAPCGTWQTVEKEVCEPEMVTENRVVKCTECAAETRQRTVTTYHQVPVTQTVQRQYTVLVQETRTRECCHTVCKPVYRTVSQQYCVPTSHLETRQCTRQVCQTQQVKELRTVCEDQGHWEERACETPCASTCSSCSSSCSSCAPACNACAPAAACTTCAPVTQKVWVPNVVQKQVEVTCCKQVLVPETYTYQVCIAGTETRTREVQVCEYQQEVVKTQVPYTVCVPHCETKAEQVTTYQCQPVQSVENYTVLVPHEVEKTIQVCVCHMVTKKVPCQVWVPAPPQPCQSSCDSGCGASASTSGCSSCSSGCSTCSQ